jgi:hypothetical protein
MSREKKPEGRLEGRTRRNTLHALPPDDEEEEEEEEASPFSEFASAILVEDYFKLRIDETRVSPSSIHFSYATKQDI